MRRKRKKNFVLFIMILIILSGTIYYIVSKNSYFDIQEIEIKGNKKITENEILLSSGLAIGDNILNVRKGNFKKKMDSNPYLEDVNINMKFPNKITINIKEKEEIAVIDGERKLYVDKNFNVLSIKKEFSEKNLPVIIGVKIDDVSINNSIFENKDIKKKDFKKLSPLLKDNYFKMNIDNIEITKKQEIKINFEDSRKIYLGNFEKLDYKYKFLIKIIENLNMKNKDFKSIDFTKGKRVIVSHGLKEK